jgi:hypothetical protein
MAARPTSTPTAEGGCGAPGRPGLVVSGSEGSPGSERPAALYAEIRKQALVTGPSSLQMHLFSRTRMPSGSQPPLGSSMRSTR